jgi:hypothetical protein
VLHDTRPLEEVNAPFDDIPPARNKEPRVASDRLNTGTD